LRIRNGLRVIGALRVWGDSMPEQTSVVQRAYEFVIRAGRVVRTREVVAALGAESVSAVTFALTRLVREGNLEKVGYAQYRARTTDLEETRRDPTELDPRLRRIFEAIRPVLEFDDLVFLYNIVLTTMRVAPDLFRADQAPAESRSPG
jgi:hypothetical protein